MKKLFVLVLLAASALYGGFFADSNASLQKEDQENARLCKLFTQKAETYEKNMRSDELAIKTLASYKKRAALYCDRIKK